ncbi:hypothetical protein Nepgr_005348 [Nepenthes gracilis]|uniref:Uncharacterized protein n=1 Tax=Nepenthes gracilis TaxID=150966 RepID=A0AAD3XG80_NEPGR|nr:hypothetical protein Nepgr_005348 [Nepenthes gracilis]
MYNTPSRIQNPYPNKMKATSAHLLSSKKRHLAWSPTNRIETNHKVKDQYHLGKDIKPTIAIRLQPPECLEHTKNDDTNPASSAKKDKISFE